MENEDKNENQIKLVNTKFDLRCENDQEADGNVRLLQKREEGLLAQFDAEHKRREEWRKRTDLLGIIMKQQNNKKGVLEK